MYSAYESDENLLQAGDCVRLYHPESSSAISVNDRGSGDHVIRLEGFEGDSQLEKTSTNSLWIIEKEEVTEGGTIDVVSSGNPCNYRFKHLSTGRYLSGKRNVVTFNPNEPEVNITESNAWGVCADFTTRTKESLFCFEDKSGQGTLQLNAAVVLQHHQSSRYVHSGEIRPHTYPVMVHGMYLLC